jgi:hypothetical protein
MKRRFLAAVALLVVLSWNLIGSRGGGDFQAPVANEPVITESPAGGWSWFGDPRAVYDDGRTFFGYLRGSDGSVVAAAYDHSEGTVDSFVLNDVFELDDHDNPGIIVRPDGHVLAFYSQHLGSTIYQRTSTNPADVNSWGGEASLDSQLGGQQYTYPSPILTTQADGTVSDVYWLFRREHHSNLPGWYYNVSTDAGTTWALGTYTKLHNLTYSKIETNGDRIDVAASDHPAGGANKIYHLYREDAAWRNTDGTSMGPTPFDGSDMTLVYDAGANLCWIWDIAYDSAGDPRITFVEFESESVHNYKYARWDGADWIVTDIAEGGSTIAEDAIPGGALEVYYSGGVVMDHSDPNIVYASREFGGTWEMFRYTTADDGATFSEEQLTEDSSAVKHVRPVSVRNDDSVLWMSGRYDSYVDYEVGTTGD